MTFCRDLDLLLSLRAAGALDPAEAVRVDGHLASCASCRAEAEARALALSLAALPPPSPAEERALRDLPGSTLRALRGADRRRGLGKRVAAGFAIAAAAALVVLAPAVLRKGPPAVGGGAPSTAARAWQAPDPDALWSDAGLFEDDAALAENDTSSAATGGEATDAAIAALEF